MNLVHLRKLYALEYAKPRSERDTELMETLLDQATDALVKGRAVGGVGAEPPETPVETLVYDIMEKVLSDPDTTKARRDLKSLHSIIQEMN